MARSPDSPFTQEYLSMCTPAHCPSSFPTLPNQFPCCPPGPTQFLVHETSEVDMKLIKPHQPISGPTKEITKAKNGKDLWEWWDEAA